MQPEELVELHLRHRHLTVRIRRMEANAAPHLRKISGLWGRGTKGTRGGVAKPGSMTVFLRVLDDAAARGEELSAADAGRIAVACTAQPERAAA